LGENADDEQLDKPDNSSEFEKAFNLLKSNKNQTDPV
jgi:hypothetical protein